MMGRRSDQGSFADLDEWYRRIPNTSPWARIRRFSEAHLQDEAFAEWYASSGRPSIPPSYMVTLLLIQVRQGWSDREAVEEAFFDDRVKYSLGVGRMPSITCDHSTLCKYRARLLEDDLGRQLLGSVLRQASVCGLLGNDEDLVDGFMVAGAAARQGTHVLIYRAIGRVLAEVREAAVTLPTLRRSDYGQGRKPTIRWEDDRARAVLLDDLVADGRLLVAALRGAEGSLGQAVFLLDVVVEQDVEADPQGGVRIAQRVAPDRVISVVDPEMRHGRKSASVRFDGYKGHVLVRNAAPGGARLVTAVDATPANASEGSALAGLLKERVDLTGQLPAQVMGDTAYGGSAVHEAVAEVSPDVLLVAPVPPAGANGGRFKKTDFSLDLDGGQVTCPAEHTITFVLKNPVPGHKVTQTIEFPAALCGACPLRSACVGSEKHGRTLTLRADETIVQARRAEQDTAEWRDHYRERSRVEHIIRSVTAHGARYARARGLARIRLQLQLAAVAHNIVELARVTADAWRSPEPFRLHSAHLAG